MITVASLVAFFSMHQYTAYLILLLGSYFEILIGTGFFLYGEVFFISGAILAGAGILNIWVVYFWCVLGGVLGDSSSFYIGYRWGSLLLRRFFKKRNKFLNINRYNKSKKAFEELGYKAIFLSRLMGLIAKVAPFFAGCFRLKYRKFLLYNIPGVIIGIGEFLAVGYFFGFAYTKLFSGLSVFIPVGITLVVLAYVGYVVLKRDKS